MLRDIGNRMHPQPEPTPRSNSSASNSNDLRNQYQSAVNAKPARHPDACPVPGHAKGVSVLVMAACTKKVWQTPHLLTSYSARRT